MVVNVATESMVAQSVQNVNTNMDEGSSLRYGGGSSNNAGGVARVKGTTVDWDDWDE